MAKILITSTNFIDPSSILSTKLVTDLFFYEPLFKINKINADRIQNFLLHQQKNVAGIIISSQNAISSLKNSFLNRDINIFTVGKNTAQKITALGYKNVFFPVNFGAEQLSQIILQNHIEPDNKYLIYLHGPEITINFSAVLLAKNIKVLNFLAYEKISTSCFSDNMQQFLTKDNFDKIFIFSSNSLLDFFNKIQNNYLQDKLMHNNIYCISSKVATLAKSYGFSKVLLFTL